MDCDEIKSLKNHPVGYINLRERLRIPTDKCFLH